jgi:transcriptional regulator with GAF, ATPase, and Fis domain
VEHSEDFGPVLSLLQARAFDRVILFCTGPEYLERAKMVEEICRGFGCAASFRHEILELVSPIDYEEILGKLLRLLVVLRPELEGAGLSVLLDPGTPQMQTAWFLLTKSGMLDARLLQGIPPRFAGGTYKVREVNLGSHMFPRMTMRSLETEAAPLLKTRFTEFPGPAEDEHIVGRDPQFLEVLEKARRVAAYDISVLIQGETGTGKGLLARLIHEKSSRAGGPFVSLNCSAIGASLAESELFGHLKGAFTGAEHNRPGRFRAAEGGTLFLDEIGDLPAEIQPKLLRALEEKLILPVGADAELKVNVRILAATNMDLPRLIEQGRFRRDLYERLAQFTLRLPPLRERHTDIPLLIRRFLKDWNRNYQESKEISEQAMRYLLDYPWPGNVRELANSVTAMCGSCTPGLRKPIPAELLPVAILEHFRRPGSTPKLTLSLPESGLDLKALLYQVERHFYQQALKRATGHREKAAGLLGLNAPAFRKALRERFPDLAGESAEEPTIPGSAS